MGGDRAWANTSVQIGFPYSTEWALPELWRLSLLSTTNGSERLRSELQQSLKSVWARERKESKRVWEGFSPSPEISRLPGGRE